jgi:hypothetical protein
VRGTTKKRTHHNQRLASAILCTKSRERSAVFSLSDLPMSEGCSYASSLRIPSSFVVAGGAFQGKKGNRHPQPDAGRLFLKDRVQPAKQQGPIIITVAKLGHGRFSLSSFLSGISSTNRVARTVKSISR